MNLLVVAVGIPIDGVEEPVEGDKVVGAGGGRGAEVVWSNKDKKTINPSVPKMYSFVHLFCSIVLAHPLMPKR